MNSKQDQRPEAEMPEPEPERQPAVGPGPETNSTAKLKSALAAASQHEPDILLPELSTPTQSAAFPVMPETQRAVSRRPAPAEAPKPIPQQPELELTPPPGPVPVRPQTPAKKKTELQLRSVFLGGMAGCVFAGLAAMVWIWFGPQRQELLRLRSGENEQVKKFQSELEIARQDAASLRSGNQQLTGLLNAFTGDWDRPPEQPRYMKIADGVLLFWEDGMIWRKYFVYQGKGVHGGLGKLNRRSFKQTFYYLSNPTPGTWHFSIAALNKEGKETPPGESLVLHFPLE
jgi:hypothetical protein